LTLTKAYTITGTGKSVYLLRSNSHLRDTDKVNNYWKSVFVGLQSGILLLPEEIFERVILPLFAETDYVTNGVLSGLIDSFIFSVGNIQKGFSGTLDACEEVKINEIYVSKIGLIFTEEDFI